MGGILAAVVSFASYRPHPGADLELDGGWCSVPWALVQGRALLGDQERDGRRRGDARRMPARVDPSAGADGVSHGERGTVEALQDTTCTDWINRAGKSTVD